MNTLQNLEERDVKHIRCYVFSCIGLGNVRMCEELHAHIEDKTHVHDWTPPDDETLNAEVLGIEFVWRNPILGTQSLRKNDSN
jgi:hypothetical protein